MDVESNSASSGNESDYSSDEVFVDARMSVDDTDTSDSVFNKPESSSQLEVRIGPQDGRQQSINQGINQGREQSPRGEPSTQQTHRNTPDTSSVIHPIKLGRQVNIPLHSSTNTPEEFYSKGKRARMSDAEASTGQAHAIESDTHINADILHDNTSDKGMQETKSQDTNTNGNTNISAGTTTDATPSVEVSDANVNENGNANANVPMSTSGDVEVQTSEKAGKSTSTTTPEYFNVIGSGTNTAGTDTAAANSATTAKESKLAYAGQIAGTIASHGYTTLSMASSAAGRLYSYATTPSPTQPINTGLNEEQDLQLQKILDGWDAVDGDKVHEEIKDRLVVAVMGRVSAGKSTLMKALLQIDPSETDVLQVSALSGTTKDAQAFLWQLKGCEFVILDFPGFQEVFEGRQDAAEHFDSTIRGFFKYGVIDVGIYVANGVPDGSQKSDFERLAKYSSEVFLVRSKADDLESFSEKGKEKVIHQWLDQFNVDKLYLTKIIGYDPDSNVFPNARVEGVDELRNDIYESVKNKKKGALLDALKNGIKNVGLEQAGTYVTVGLAVLMAVMRAR